MPTTESKTQHGYMLIADIAGYTSFVAETELEHAHEIITELLELLLKRFTPMLSLSKLEGDAVFVYAPQERMPRGETLLELIESAYVAFRDKRDAVNRRTTCGCRACRSIPALDLKFIAHHGDFIVQRVSGIHELVGSDVNLIHRLLKNHVSEVTGWRAYAMFTDAVLNHIGIPTAGMHAQAESYEHLGAVKTYSINMQARYRELVEARRVFVKPEEADVTVSVEINAPPAIVWEWVNDPRKRSVYMEGTRWSAESRPGGRTGVGAKNHCAHGDGEYVESILDWRPFDYVTSEGELMPKAFSRMTHHFQPSPDGQSTHLHEYTILKRDGWPRWLTRLVCRVMMWDHGKAFANLKRLVEEDMSKKAFEPERIAVSEMAQA